MPTRGRFAFTLFQLLTLLSLLAFLLALFMPAIARMRAEAQKAEQLNNLKQMGLALHTHNDANGLLPAGVDENNFSAASKLLPYIEQGQVYKKINFTKPISDEVNAEARKTVIPTFLSPRDPLKKVRDDSGATNYLFNDQLFFRDSKATIPPSFPDGTSNTIVIGETLKGDGGDESGGRKAAIRPAEKGLSQGGQAGYGRRLLEGGPEHRRRPLRQLDGRPLPPGHVQRQAQAQRRAAGRELRRRGRRLHPPQPQRRHRRRPRGRQRRFINAKKLSFITWTNALDPADGNVLGPDWSKTARGGPHFSASFTSVSIAASSSSAAGGPVVLKADHALGVDQEEGGKTLHPPFAGRWGRQGPSNQERQVMCSCSWTCFSVSTSRSVLTPTRAKGRPWYCWTSDRSWPYMALQGGHQLPQKSSITTLPLIVGERKGRAVGVGPLRRRGRRAHGLFGRRRGHPQDERDERRRQDQQADSHRRSHGNLGPPRGDYRRRPGRMSALDQNNRRCRPSSARTSPAAVAAS